MHPTLLHLHLASHDLEVSTFGVLVALGCAAAIVYGVYEGKRAGEDPAALRDLGFWVTVASLVGARVAHVISGGRAAWDDCLDGIADGVGPALAACTRPLRLWEGGLVFYGGLVCGVATALYFARRRGLDTLATLDRATPALALGHVLGRLGCFAAGCCFGKPTVGLPGLRFPSDSIAYRELFARGLLEPGATHTMALHATQLYEAAGELALFFFLARLVRHKRYHGQVALAYLLTYAPLRFVIELFRGDVSRGMVLAPSTDWLNRWIAIPPGDPAILSTSQAAGLVIFVAAALLWARAHPRPRTATPSSSSSPPAAASR